MKKREIVNWALHTGVALVLVALVLFHRWFLLLDVIVWATLREQAQHRYELTECHTSFGMRYEVRKRTFWDWSWFRWHHLGEIGQWALGAALALGVYEIFIV